MKIRSALRHRPQCGELGASLDCNSGIYRARRGKYRVSSSLSTRGCNLVGCGNVRVCLELTKGVSCPPFVLKPPHFALSFHRVLAAPVDEASTKTSTCAPEANVTACFEARERSSTMRTDDRTALCFLARPHGMPSLPLSGPRREHGSSEAWRELCSSLRTRRAASLVGMGAWRARLGRRE